VLDELLPPHAESESVIAATSDRLSAFLTFLDFIMKILLKILIINF
jgi:hypothetical protein